MASMTECYAAAPAHPSATPSSDGIAPTALGEGGELEVPFTEVFNPDFKCYYKVPTSCIVHIPHTRLNITRLVLCRNYKPHDVLSCTMGRSCKFVHADCDYAALPSHSVHVNYVWRSEDVCIYPRLPTGTSFEVHTPGVHDTVEKVASQVVLYTAAFMVTTDDAKRVVAATPVLYHCADYCMNRMCKAGDQCDKVHVLCIDPTAQFDFRRAPVRVFLGVEVESKKGNRRRLVTEPDTTPVTTSVETTALVLSPSRQTCTTSDTRGSRHSSLPRNASVPSAEMTRYVRAGPAPELVVGHGPHPCASLPHTASSHLYSTPPTSHSATTVTTTPTSRSEEMQGRPALQPFASPALVTGPQTCYFAPSPMCSVVPVVSYTTLSSPSPPMYVSTPFAPYLSHDPTPPLMTALVTSNAVYSEPNPVMTTSSTPCYALPHMVRGPERAPPHAPSERMGWQNGSSQWNGAPSHASRRPPCASASAPRRTSTRMTLCPDVNGAPSCPEMPHFVPPADPHTGAGGFAESAGSEPVPQPSMTAPSTHTLPPSSQTMSTQEVPVVHDVESTPSRAPLESYPHRPTSLTAASSSLYFAASAAHSARRGDRLTLNPTHPTGSPRSVTHLNFDSSRLSGQPFWMSSTSTRRAASPSTTVLGPSATSCKDATTLPRADRVCRAATERDENGGIDTTPLRSVTQPTAHAMRHQPNLSHTSFVDTRSVTPGQSWTAPSLTQAFLLGLEAADSLTASTTMPMYDYNESVGSVARAESEWPTSSVTHGVTDRGRVTESSSTANMTSRVPMPRFAASCTAVERSGGGREWRRRVVLHRDERTASLQQPERTAVRELDRVQRRRGAITPDGTAVQLGAREADACGSGQGGVMGKDALNGGRHKECGGGVQGTHSSPRRNERPRWLIPTIRSAPVSMTTPPMTTYRTQGGRVCYRNDPYALASRVIVTSDP